MTDLQWGGQVRGATQAGHTFSGRVFGTFSGSRPEGIDDWIGKTIVRALTGLLCAAHSARAATADLSALSEAVTSASAAELAEQGVAGVATVVGAVINEDVPAAARMPGGSSQPVPMAPSAMPSTRSAVEQTAIGAVAPLIGDALPFQTDASAPPPRAVPLADGGARPDLSGATGFMAPPEDLDDPIPFDKKPPELTVEQYASLCVERALNPGDDSAVAQRYRVLTEQALRSLDERWRQRFQAEGELYRRWQAAYAQYEAWLKSRG